MRTHSCTFKCAIKYVRHMCTFKVLGFKKNHCTWLAPGLATIVCPSSTEHMPTYASCCMAVRMCEASAHLLKHQLVSCIRGCESPKAFCSPDLLARKAGSADALFFQDMAIYVGSYCPCTLRIRTRSYRHNLTQLYRHNLSDRSA